MPNRPGRPSKKLKKKGLDSVDNSSQAQSLFLLDHEFEPQNAWLQIGDTLDIDVSHNPLNPPDGDIFYHSNPGFWEIRKMMDSNYIGYTAWVLLGLTLFPYQQVILKNMWDHVFTMLIASRGGSKSFCLAVYCLLKCMLTPNYKIVLTAPSFRQSKLIFDEIEKLWNSAPVYRSIAGDKSGPIHKTDGWVFHINNSSITAIPTGNGEKIRGIRANTIILDEFAHQDPEIVEEVVMGFGVVSNNPVENVKRAYREEYFKKHNIIVPIEEKPRSNQAIYSGTADYYDNHFYTYWKRHKAIIESKGDRKKLLEIFDGNLDEDFNWKNYCVIRLPYSMLPKGYMESSFVQRARSTMAKSLYLKEYEAIFVEDSDGFFKRSVIEGCTASQKHIDDHKWQEGVPWCKAPFDARMKGDPNLSYVLGIDPAAESDNLAICMLEVHPNHHRVVHSWVTNRKNFEKRKMMGLTACNDYWQFITRKVRDLMKDFHIIGIGIDMQGGGSQLYEAMHNPDFKEPGELLLWLIQTDDEKRDCDDNPGLHIVHPIQFIKYDWTVKANYDLLKDMETRQLLFPRFDPISLELSVFEDKKRFGMSFEPTKSIGIIDSFEACIMDIEVDLKNELTSVQLTKSGQRLNWKVPPTMNAEDAKKVQKGKKDRYSALVIANSIARTLHGDNVNTGNDYTKFSKGGLLEEIKAKRGQGLYEAPEWFTTKFGV